MLALPPPARGDDDHSMVRRRIVVAVFDGVELLDVAGPIQVFSAANRLLGFDAGYDTSVVGPAAGPITCAGGTRLLADAAWTSLRHRVDTLIVAGAMTGGTYPPRAMLNEDLIHWLRTRAASRADRIASVCAGAHLLAAAGLLEGKRAATHWATIDELAAEHPTVDVDRDAIFVCDGAVWTSAGVTSGMDLALAIVAKDHGEPFARHVAKWLVMYLKRPGGQSQFSALLSAAPAEQPAVAEVQQWIPENLDAELSVASLAARAHMSERNFSRVFRNEVGIPPARYVERLRVEAVGRELIDTDRGLEAITRTVGFGSVETLHRAFRARFGVSPGAYRARFTLGK